MLKTYRQLVSKINPFRSAEQKIQKESMIYEANRKEVLRHYRYLLKAIPALYSRRLQQRTVYLVPQPLRRNSATTFTREKSLPPSMNPSTASATSASVLSLR
jgi:hypothetical protein